MTDPKDEPPLPEPCFRSVRRGGIWAVDGWNEEQIRAYAAPLVARIAELEADCAKAIQSWQATVRDVCAERDALRTQLAEAQKAAVADYIANLDPPKDEA